MDLAEWKTKKRTHESRSTQERAVVEVPARPPIRGPHHPLPVPIFCLRKDWGSPLEREDEDKAEKGTPGVDLLCFHWKEPQPEFGNNPERKLLGKQDISCSCFFFNNISEKENKECITINRWTASTLNRALRSKWSLLRKETGQGESTHTTQEETVARWDTCYYKC